MAPISNKKTGKVSFVLFFDEDNEDDKTMKKKKTKKMKKTKNKGDRIE